MSLPVLLIRSEGNDTDAASLNALGISSIDDPYVRIAPVGDPMMAHMLVEQLRERADEQTWFIATSPMTMPALIELVGEHVLREAIASAVSHGVHAAATGERTARTLRELGFPTVMVPMVSSAKALVEELADLPPARALFPCGNLALDTLPDGLSQLGWHLAQVVVYETSTVAQEPMSVELIRRCEVSAIVLRSPSAARALVHFVSPPIPIPVICAGSTTADAARELGLDVVAVADSPGADHVAAAVAQVLSA
ncbi:MAG: uroporphyrinogen-III synthase [Candidatus Nanopelagicales bacterium]